MKGKVEEKQCISLFSIYKDSEMCPLYILDYVEQWLTSYKSHLIYIVVYNKVNANDHTMLKTVIVIQSSKLCNIGCG